MSAQPPPPAPPGPPPPSGFDPPGTAPRQLPPLSMVAGVDLRTIAFGVIAILSGGPVAWVIAVAFAGAIAAVRVAHWSRFRYGFDGAVVRVEQGVLQRQTRALDVGRIQQVEIDQPLVHRILGLAVLRLETASEGGQTEVELDGLALADAEALRAALRPAVASTPAPGDPASGDDGVPGPPPTTHTVLEVPLGHLALSAVTGVQLFALPAALAVFGQALADVGADDTVGDQVVGLARGGGIALLVVLVAVGAFVAAVVAAVLRDGNYRVERRGDDVVVRRGLLTTRETVLPRHRVQVVEVRQNWLRRALGMASVQVRSAGGGAARDEGRRLQVPLVPARGEAIDALLDTLLPARPDPATFRAHPPTARRRSITRSTLRMALVAAVLVVGALALRLTEVLVVPWVVVAVVAAVLVLAVGPALGLAAFRHLAHAVGHDVLGSRHGLFGVTTSFAPLHRLQGVTEVDSPFQRRLGLSSVHGHLAGAGLTTTIVVHDVAVTTAQALRDDLTVAAAGLDPVGR